MQSGDWQGWPPTALLGGRVSAVAFGHSRDGRIGQAVPRAALGRVRDAGSLPQPAAACAPRFRESLARPIGKALIKWFADGRDEQINSPHPKHFHLMNARAAN